MSFILRWLGFVSERPSGIAVRPSRTVALEASYDSAFERCIRGLEDVVGAQIRDMDREHGTIDATFGLMFSERVACIVQRIDDGRTQVTLESRRIAGSGLPKDSAVLDRLYEWITLER